MAKRKPPKFKRRQYKLNWREILMRVEQARQFVGTEFPLHESLAPLDEAIEALRDRLDMPLAWQRTIHRESYR